MSIISRAIKQFLTVGILCYRSLRPLLGTTTCCTFEVSCSEYALRHIKTEPLGVALWAIGKRLSRCHPFF